MRQTRFLFIVLGLFLGGLSLSACGKIQTQILETSVALNTDDTIGPYQVMAAVVSDQVPLQVKLIYFINNDTSTKQEVEMKQISQDVYQGAIPGQPAGTTIEYYIQALDSEKFTTTDPLDAQQQNGLTYRFRVQN